MSDRDEPPEPPAIEPGDDVSDAVRRELTDVFSSGTADDAAVMAAAGVGDRRKVIVIDADDLPDAVQLEDDRGRRVVIDDDGAGPARATAPPKVDPRLRARRIAVRRAAGRRRLRVTVIAGAVVVTALILMAVLASPIFAIDTVVVEGAVYTDRDALGDVVEELKGQTTLLADVDAAERQLLEIPWVKDARVTRDFPSRALVEIVERRPLAHFRGEDGRFRVIDVDGVVLAVIDGVPIDYVEITGRGPNLRPGDDAGNAYRGAAQLANALPPMLRPRVTSMAVSETGDITLVLDGGTVDATAASPITVEFGQPSDYQDKLVALVNELERHAPGEISSIDVSSGSPTVS